MSRPSRIHREVLVVVYDRGSVSPSRVAGAAADLECDVVFVASGSEHSRQMLDVLALFGRVVDAAMLDWTELVRALEQVRPTGIITFSEYQLGPTALLAAELGLAHHAPEDIPAITRKDEQRRRFAAADIDGPRFHPVSQLSDIGPAVAQVGMPAIVKPVVGASSRHTASVTTEAEATALLTGFLETEDSMLLEELLVGRPTPGPWGDYIAVDCVAVDGDVAPLFVTSKFAVAPPYRERGGYGARSVVGDADVKEVQDLACRAVKALNIRHGIADVEVKLTADGPRVIEVNGRLGGWVDDLAMRSAAADPVDIAIRVALGRAVEVRPVPDGPIAFHYLCVPPIDAVAVRRIHDRAQLSRLPHVERVAVMARPGSSADWRLGAPTTVAAVLGTTDNHDQLADVVAAIESVDWIEYD